MKPLLGFLAITIISAFCGMMASVVLAVDGASPLIRDEMLGYLIGWVGGPVSAIVIAYISARLTYGILAKVSYFEFSKTSPKGWLGAGTVAGILAVIGYFPLMLWYEALRLHLR